MNSSIYFLPAAHQTLVLRKPLCWITGRTFATRSNLGVNLLINASSAGPRSGVRSSSVLNIPSIYFENYEIK